MIFDKVKIHKVGIIGFGKMGKIRYENISSILDMNIIGIYDNDTSDIPKELIYDKPSKLIEDSDIVFICAPPIYAYEYTIYALKANKHVFCEKPPCLNLSQMKKIAKRINNNKYKIGFNHRYHSSVFRAKSLIDSGELGNIMWIRAIYGKSSNDSWRNNKDISGGGILFDQGIHSVDLIRFFLGNVSVNYSKLVTSYWKDSNVEDNAIIVFEKDNRFATLHSSSTMWEHKFLFEIYLTNGYITLDGLITSSNTYAPELLKVYKCDEDKVIPNAKEDIFKIERDYSFYLEVQDFMDSIRNNKPIVNGNYEDGLEIMKIIDTIYSDRRTN